MEHLHDSAHNHFRGVRTRATRRSKTILDKLHAPLIDETKAVPLFDSSTGSIWEVTTKYLLDFMYYKQGGRRTPRNLVLGDSVFDEPMSRVNVTANPETESSAVGTLLVPLVDHDLLSDSDDDDDPVVAPSMAIAAAETTRVQPPTVQRASRKRAREVPDDASDDIDSLVALRETYTRNPTMIRNIDQLISMNQTPGDERSFQSLSAPTTDSQSQFRPTAMQRQIHRHLVNGTYACMSARLLLETLQISLQTLDLLPHPAVIRAFFSWDFATQGLSVMHFVSLSDVERRERRSASDMSDFSRKNKLPRPSAAGDLATVVDALGGLAAVVKIAYQPFVSTLVEEAQVFVRKLSRSTLGRNFGIPTARSELVNWIDERFECVRLLLTQGQVDAAQAVHGAFQEGDASFAKLIQVVSECRLTHSEKQMTATATRNGPSSNTRGAQQQHEFRRKVKEVKHERPEITADMVQMLPELNGKRLCMKYLSKMGCPSTREGCFSRRRGHFRPDNIPATIRNLIVQHYGVFKPELADITVVTDQA
ncbi:hypothetical protein PF007_g21523 [Phytophthora fragariae]|uniref:Uncharacterized protein n=4 Tax=Phytophthora fragariae TaxID=53985 RepID=A0A6A4EY47_9STRA|nr:hypothetical protein PF007_g21523 [Phytophthora fragariae]KAE9325239.1 hypothetical protein PF001_g3034 [Phytophthora fragariae]